MADPILPGHHWVVAIHHGDSGEEPQKEQQAEWYSHPAVDENQDSSEHSYEWRWRETLGDAADTVAQRSPDCQRLAHGA